MSAPLVILITLLELAVCLALLRWVSSRLKKRKLLRMIVRLLIVAAIGDVLSSVVLYFRQDSLIFQGIVYHGDPEIQITAPPGCRLVSLTTQQGDHFIALYGPALLANRKIDPKSNQRRTILYFYGNGGAIAWDIGEFQQFRQLDANVLMPDYVGYGMSSGSPSEANLYATADACYDFVISRGTKPDQIVDAGWSLGAAVAIDLASRRKVAALATFNAFTTLRQVAQKLVPYVWLDPILKFRFDNLDKIKTIRVPTFICNGAMDTLIPPGMSGALAASSGGPVTRVVVPSADHNTIFTADPDRVFPAMDEFLSRIPYMHWHMSRGNLAFLTLLLLSGCTASTPPPPARIDSFQGPYRFLSNFWPATVEFEGLTYPDVEHAYQSAKTLDMSERRRIAALPTPAEAKHAGEALKYRPDWPRIKYDVMLQCVRYKFTHHPDLAAKLLATGDAYLEEGNTWNDQIWGVYQGKGTNWLGKILMQVRSELRAER